MRREPDGVMHWPPNIIGSLTHKEGSVGVAMAPQSKYLGLGIDAENCARLKSAFEERLCNANESKLLDELCEKTSKTREEWLAVFFSFKESIFKCHYPLGRVMFYFLDAEIIKIDPKGQITAKLLKTVSPMMKTNDLTSGHYLWIQDDRKSLVLSACWLLP